MSVHKHSLTRSLAVFLYLLLERAVIGPVKPAVRFWQRHRPPSHSSFTVPSKRRLTHVEAVQLGVITQSDAEWHTGGEREKPESESSAV